MTPGAARREIPLTALRRSSFLLPAGSADATTAAAAPGLPSSPRGRPCSPLSRSSSLTWRGESRTVFLQDGTGGRDLLSPRAAPVAVDGGASLCSVSSRAPAESRPALAEQEKQCSPGSRHLGPSPLAPPAVRVQPPQEDTAGGAPPPAAASQQHAGGGTPRAAADAKPASFGGASSSEEGGSPPALPPQHNDGGIAVPPKLENGLLRASSSAGRQEESAPQPMSPPKRVLVVRAAAPPCAFAAVLPGSVMSVPRMLRTDDAPYAPPAQAEDDKLSRVMISKFLTKWGFGPLTVVEDGLLAIEAFKNGALAAAHAAGGGGLPSLRRLPLRLLRILGRTKGSRLPPLLPSCLQSLWLWSGGRRREWSGGIMLFSSLPDSTIPARRPHPNHRGIRYRHHRCAAEGLSTVHLVDTATTRARGRTKVCRLWTQHTL